MRNDPQNQNESFIEDIVPPLPFEQTAELERDTSTYLQDRGLRAGPCPHKQLTDALKERVRFLTEASFSLTTRCEPVSLLRALVAANEGVRACLSSLTWAATDRPDVSLSTKEWARTEMPVLTPLSVSLRLVVEMISARPPQGETEASPELLTALWGHADEVLRLGTTSDQGAENRQAQRQTPLPGKRKRFGRHRRSHRRARTLLNIEAKSGSAARTPREACSELARFRVTGKDNTDADRVLERAKLIEEAIPDALNQLGVESSTDDWRVRSAIVLKSPPVANLLDPSALPIVGFTEFTQLDLQKWIGQLP